MKQALRIIGANPAVGGLLIRGERGTAKSSAVRALAALLPPIPVVAGCPFNCDPAAPFPGCPHCSRLEGDLPVAWRPVPFVELPVGATEDRVLGTLDVGRALARGEWHFEPGLVARAHRGILYIDEVNLLPDHLVDVLLDAAAAGWHTVEREGVSFAHPARFILVGTMNPEEGELRPQFLDRFALAVDVTTPADPALRAEAVTRVVAFEADPEGFCARWREQEEAERRRLAEARRLLPQVEVPPAAVQAIAAGCAAAGVEGLRADIVAYKAAATLAALAGRTRVTDEDVAQALALALAHRRPEGGGSEPPAGPAGPGPWRPPGTPPAGGAAPPGAAWPPPGGSPAGGPPPAGGPGSPTGSAAPPGGPPPAGGTGGGPSPGANVPGAGHGAAVQPVGPALDLPGADPARGRRRPLRLRKAQRGRGAAYTLRPGGRGRWAGAALPRGRVTALALGATLQAAAARRARSGGAGAGAASPLITPADLRQRLVAVPMRRLIVFVVDASGSMGARGRMAAAKGAALTLLAGAYRRRDPVALVVFRGEGAQVVLPPTRSVRAAARRLRDVPTGGRTPLAAGLAAAAAVLERHRRRSPGDLPMAVILTDARANVGGADPWAAALAAADRLRRTGAESLVLDSEAGPVRLGLARRLAAALGARYVRLDHLSAAGITAAVRTLLLGREGA